MPFLFKSDTRHSLFFAIAAALTLPFGLTIPAAAAQPALLRNFTTKLPILRLDTRGAVLGLNNELTVDVKLLTNQENRAADLAQTPALLEAELKVRGNSSKEFAKKQFDLQFSEAIPLFGLPASKRWVLSAPYLDRNLLKNNLAFTMARELPDGQGGQWYAPRTQAFELFINDSYRGLYILVEKVEIAKHKVNIGKFDFQAPEKSEFILKLERKEGQQLWEFFKTKQKSHVSFYEPKAKELAKLAKSNPDQAKRAYAHMRRVMDRFETAMLAIESGNYSSYRQLIDTTSFINFILMHEVLRNVDGLRRSIWLQYRSDGKIYAGPIWDFDLAMGGIVIFNARKTKGFQIGSGFYPDFNHEFFWFRQMLRDPSFVRELTQRYQEMRRAGGPLSNRTVLGHFDRLTAEVRGSVQDRNYRVWNANPGTKDGIIPDDGLIPFVIPRYIPFRYDNVAAETREWLVERLDWLDRNIHDVDSRAGTLKKYWLDRVIKRHEPARERKEP